MGGAPAGPKPWRSPAISEHLAKCSVLWTETPPAGPEAQALAIQYGLDPSRPLASRIPGELLTRVEAAAAVLTVAPALIAVVRPWLAAQVLQMGSTAASGIDPEGSPDAVLMAEARHLNIQLRHEFADLGAIMAWFSGLPEQAEAEYLSLILDELDQGEMRSGARHEAWQRGDLTLAEAEASRVIAHYPALYQEMVVARNRGWLPRFEEAAQSGERHFFVIGTGHLVGASNTLALAADAGFQITRF